VKTCAASVNEFLNGILVAIASVHAADVRFVIYCSVSVMHCIQLSVDVEVIHGMET